VTELELHGAAFVLVELGIAAVAAVLLVPIIYRIQVALRIVLNAAFVIGMLTILVGIDTLVLSLELDLYVIGLEIFWTTNRILVSRFNHDKAHDMLSK